MCVCVGFVLFYGVSTLFESFNTEPSPDYYVSKSKVKLATVVEGDPKAPFSIATTPRCREGRYSISLIAKTLSMIHTL